MIIDAQGYTLDKLDDILVRLEEILNEFQRLQIFRCSVYLLRFGVQRLHRTTNRIMEDFSI